MRQGLIEATELTFMLACGEDRPIPAEAIDYLPGTLRAHPELTREERVEVADFALEWIATENALLRIPEEEVSEVGLRALAAVQKQLRAGLI